MASPLLQTALYPSESEVNMKEVDMIYPSLKSRHKQEEHPDHRVQKCSQGLLFWGRKRKLFLLKDQESFCFLIYNLDRGLSNFHVLPGRCFVSARFCALPLLFNTSCFSVLIFLHFWVLEFWRAQGQSEGIPARGILAGKRVTAVSIILQALLLTSCASKGSCSLWDPFLFLCFIALVR